MLSEADYTEICTTEAFLHFLEWFLRKICRILEFADYTNYVQMCRHKLAWYKGTVHGSGFFVDEKPLVINFLFFSVII